jgi:hypothetical protein
MSIAVLTAAPGNYYTWSIIGHIPVPSSYTQIWQYP